jgi:hypothetical protein
MGWQLSKLKFDTIIFERKYLTHGISHFFDLFDRFFPSLILQIKAKRASHV